MHVHTGTKYVESTDFYNYIYFKTLLNFILKPKVTSIIIIICNYKRFSIFIFLCFLCFFKLCICYFAGLVSEIFSYAFYMASDCQGRQYYPGNTGNCRCTYQLSFVNISSFAFLSVIYLFLRHCIHILCIILIYDLSQFSSIHLL